MKRVLPLLLVVGAALLQPVAAHQRSESFSEWRWSQGMLELRFTVAAREASRLAPGRRVGSLPAVVARYLPGRVAPAGRGATCEVSAPISARLSASGHVIATGAWRCERAPDRIRIAAFFDVAPEHAHLATWRDGAQTVQHYVTADQSDWLISGLGDPGSVADSRSEGRGEQFLSAAGQGIRHALSGLDHLLFLLALLLACRRLGALAWAITGFTIGHSISLSLAAMGALVPVIPVVESAIGLTIALVAAERLGAGRLAAASIALLVLAVLLVAGRSGLSAASGPVAAGFAVFALCYLLLARESGDASWFRMAATVLFGLIHGLGFAAAFQVIGFPTADLAWSLAGFNIGVELGQIAAVAAAVLLGHAAVRLTGPRPLALDLAAAGVCAMGVFWFVARGAGG